MKVEKQQQWRRKWNEPCKRNFHKTFPCNHWRRLRTSLGNFHNFLSAFYFLENSRNFSFLLDFHSSVLLFLVSFSYYLFLSSLAFGISKIHSQILVVFYKCSMHKEEIRYFKKLDFHIHNFLFSNSYGIRMLLHLHAVKLFWFSDLIIAFTESFKIERIQSQII